ncbi:MAG: hypothetical protein ACMVP2_16735 [Imperialibacter sp.]|uniref:hypothetical protein n=1 Tax=Imperialibacter sp. TaxID=2038411 RepID=UPI003A89C4A0
MEEKILFRIKLDIPELDKYYPVKSEPVTNEYEAELILNWPEELMIKIYFNDLERLDNKFAHWSHQYEHNILNRITVTETISPKDLILVDFCNYSYKGMTVASNFYEYGLKYFTIKLRGIKLGYKNREKDDSIFYLNEASFKLIELNYFYCKLPLKLDHSKVDFSVSPADQK